MHRKLILATLGASCCALAHLACGTDNGRNKAAQGAGGDDSTAAAGPTSGPGGATGGSSVGAGGNGGSGIVITPHDGGSKSDAGQICADAAACAVGCGNGKIDPGLGEECDDGNTKSADGCTPDCKVEKDWACPQPGMPCVYLVKCGDGRIGGRETCDDANTKDGDGCSAMCGIERGWDCPLPGQLCVPHCGDGTLAGTEECDPPNVGQGCSAACKFEPGYVCNAPPMVPNPSQPSQCHKTVCGDGRKEGAEACDDSNVVDGDGCSAACTFEPDCATGNCSSKCGDGMKLPPEACDDGNTKDGDGCAHDCKLEMGYTCNDTSLNPPDRLNLLAVYRDFVAFAMNGSTRHPDYESFGPSDLTTGLVKDTLDANGKPVIDGRCSTGMVTLANCPWGQELSNAANFQQWYRDTANVNMTVRGALLLPRQANGYVYDSDPKGFYPLDGKGWVATAPVKESLGQSAAGVNDGLKHNFGFSTEVRYFFQYRGGETLSFSGDDDVWVFVNRKLGLDLGGLHPRREGTLNMDTSAAALGLVVNGIYEVALFHAERHTDASNFKLTLTGFAPTYSTCGPTCGDGIVAGTERCDLGRDMNTGGYNGCTADCKPGPFCGDGTVEPDHEKCDDGINITIYSMNGMPGCAPGCMPSSFCGDAKVDGLFGEQCDLGTAMNTGAYDGCTATCQLGPRCGDGVVQRDQGEQCDDGNTVGGDGCTHDCHNEIVP
jgi:fibro-slime domain-containing protein